MLVDDQKINYNTQVNDDKFYTIDFCNEKKNIIKIERRDFEVKTRFHQINYNTHKHRHSYEKK